MLQLQPACEATEVRGEGSPVSAVFYRSGQPAPIDDLNSLPAYVAQCEAVLGPIPEMHCDPADPAPGSVVTKIPVLADGKLLGFGDDDTELARRAEQQDYTCDFPSIGGDFPCTVGSTLVQYRDATNPNVQWVALCRGVARDVPAYNRFVGNGLIGANELTGEMCFLFGSNPEPDAPYVLPPLASDVEPGDLAPWLAPEDMPGSCLSCHPNNDPWVLTPWLQPEYMRRVLLDPDYPLSMPRDLEVDDIMAARSIVPTPVAYKSLLPEPLPPGRTAWTEEEIVGEDGELLRRQYRAVGSSYVRNEARGGVLRRTGILPVSWAVNFRDRLRLHTSETSCANGCHALANEFTDELAWDSLGEKFATKYLSVSMSSGTLAGHSWMPPAAGDSDTWRERYAKAEATVPAITECPIPKRLGAAPEFAIRCNAAESVGVVDIEWVYVNDYGQVPERDDIRFDVAMTFNRAGDEPPRVASNDTPEGAAMQDDVSTVRVLRNVAADEHMGAVYRVRVPFGSAQRSLHMDIQPKRFCFEEPERRPFAYAQPHHLDIALDCD